MQRPVSPGGTALRAQLVERMTSPELTDGLRDMHEKMAIKQITALEKRVKELEGENMRLKEQVRRGLCLPVTWGLCPGFAMHKHGCVLSQVDLRVPRPEYCTCGTGVTASS